MPLDFDDTAGSGKPAFEPTYASSPRRPLALPHQLIGNIYDTVLDQSLWPSVLEGAARFVGGPAASLFSKDAASNSATLAYDCGVDPHYRRLYCDKYVRFDPTSAGQSLARIGEPTATGDLICYQEFLETRFYREWARPQRLVDFVSVVIDRSASDVAMFGVFRHADNGLVDEEVHERVRLIAPHIRRAVLIGKAIEWEQARAAAFHEVLDGLSAGIFLANGDSRVVHANNAGRAMLAGGDFLRLVRGRLAACDAAADRALRAAFAAAASGDDVLGTGAIALPLVSFDNDEKYVAHILPMTSGARNGSAGAEAAVALFVRKATFETSSVPAAIARHFKLTPTEFRVLLSLLEVGSGPEVAEALGVAENTIKTHLGRIFQKTDTRRQLELVKLVAGFASPLVS